MIAAEKAGKTPQQFVAQGRLAPAAAVERGFLATRF
eukprot:gene31616-39056_t